MRRGCSNAGREPVCYAWSVLFATRPGATAISMTAKSASFRQIVAALRSVQCGEVMAMLGAHLFVGACRFGLIIRKGQTKGEGVEYGAVAFCS